MKKIGLAKQRDMLELNHYYSLKKPFDFSKEAKTVSNFVSAPVQAVTDVVKETQNIVKETQNIVSQVVPDVTIAKEDMSLKGVGKGLANGLTTVYENSIGLGARVINKIDEKLLNNNISGYTGDIFGDAEKAGNTLRELSRGDDVEDNLKAGARVGIVAGAIALTGGGASAVMAGMVAAQQTAGMSEGTWGNVASGIAQAFLPDGISDIVSALVNPQQGAKYETTYTPTSAADQFIYENLEDMMPVIVVGAGAVIALLLIMKVKKH